MELQTDLVKLLMSDAYLPGKWMHCLETWSYADAGLQEPWYWPIPYETAVQKSN